MRRRETGDLCSASFGSTTDRWTPHTHCSANPLGTMGLVCPSWYTEMKVGDSWKDPFWFCRFSLQLDMAVLCRRMTLRILFVKDIYFASGPTYDLLLWWHFCFLYCMNSPATYQAYIHLPIALQLHLQPHVLRGLDHRWFAFRAGYSSSWGLWVWHMRHFDYQMIFFMHICAHMQ